MDIKKKEVISVLFDPHKDNKEFKCDICYKYLSVTPILFHKTVGKICGRCAHDEATKNLVSTPFQRQIVFEEISKHIVFPCSYESKGCNEQLKGGSIAAHEEVCQFKNDKCMFGNNCLRLYRKACEWTGNSKELISHLKECHNDHFQEFPSVKMSLTPDCADRIVLTEYMGILFTCLMHVNHGMGMLFIHVLMDTTSNPCKDYTYDFEVSDECNKKKMNFLGNEVNPLSNRAFTEVFFTTGLDIHIQSLGTQLKSSSFEFTFRIKTNRPDLFEAISEPVRKDNKLIFHQECTTCKSILLPPIYTCYNSHNACDNCYQNRRCQCEEKISGRNEILEKISKISLYNCKNKNSGCQELLDYRGLPKHELNCKLTEKNCVMGCDFKGTNIQILQHVKEKHSLIDLNKKHFLELKSRVNIFCAIFEENIFVLNITYFQHSLSVGVRYLSTQSGSFQYKFSIFSGFLNLNSTSFCYPISYGEDEILKGDINYPFDFLKQFLTDQSYLYFKLDIFRTPNCE